MHELADRYGNLPAYEAYRSFYAMDFERSGPGESPTRYEWLIAGKPVKFKASQT